MSSAITTTEIFLIAMGIIFTVPYLIWRLLHTDYYAPLVVVQILAGVVLGPGILGKFFPGYYAYVFPPAVVAPLNAFSSIRAWSRVRPSPPCCSWRWRAPC